MNQYPRLCITYHSLALVGNIGCEVVNVGEEGEKVLNSAEKRFVTTIRKCCATHKKLQPAKMTSQARVRVFSLAAAALLSPPILVATQNSCAEKINILQN